MPRMIGSVLYDGPSELDGGRIIVVLTGFQRVSNPKTGKMLQTWIMSGNVDPREAKRTGADETVCGDCPHRQNQGGSCYVIIERAPLKVWRAWKRDRYENWTSRFPDNALQGRRVRFGSYGDPAAVPYKVWRRVLAQKLAGWTGYTHQWKRQDALVLRKFLMASVDSEAEMQEAQSAGWRTFRVRDSWEATSNEVGCPASAEMGKRTDCNTCQLCKGQNLDAKSISILAHGFLVKRRKLVIAV